MFADYLVQMKNSCIQMLDFNLEVVYPIDYLAQAIPLAHPARDTILLLSRHLLLHGDFWSLLVNNSLFYHPREIAVAIFDQAVTLKTQQYQILKGQELELAEEKAQLENHLELLSC